MTAPDAPTPGGLAADATTTGGPTGVIAVAGEALVDLVPAPVGGYFEIAPGGSPANVALGLARLGVPARLLARISDDLLGRRIRAHLTHNGVQLDHAVAAKEQTSLAMVSLDERGSPAYDFRIAGTADWQWTPAEVAGALEAGSSGPVVALHSGSLALTTAPGDAVLRDLLMRASDTITISYDPNCRPMLMGNPVEVLRGVHEMLGAADVVKVSSEDLHWLVPDMTPEQVVDDWLSRGPDARRGDARVGRRGRRHLHRAAGPAPGRRGEGHRHRRSGRHVLRRAPRGAVRARPARRRGPGPAADVGLQHAGRTAARRGARRGDRLLAAGRRPAHPRRPATVPARLAHLLPIGRTRVVGGG